MRARPSQHQVIHKRIVKLTVFLLFVFGLVAVRLFILQVFSNNYYRALAEDQYTLVKTLTPERGQIEIVDKFSAVPQAVAANITKDLVFANPVSIKDPKAVADALAPILKMESKEILDKISDKSK